MRQGEGIAQTQQVRNAGVMRGWFPRWTYQTAWNLHKITKEFEAEPKAGKVKALKDCQPGFTKPDFFKNRVLRGPAIICGAGPSLDDSIEHLKKSKMPTFIPETLLGTFRYHGVRADYVCNYDAAQHWDPFLKGYDKTGSTLITHPGVDPRVIDHWEGDKIYYLMNHVSQVNPDLMKDGMTLGEIVAVIKEQIFGSELFEAVNPLLYPMIATTILNAGCVVNNALQVANFMGYGPLFLVGVDFGYSNNQSRCTGWYKRKGKWECEEPFSVTEENLTRDLYISNNGVSTTEEQMEYKMAMMAVYRIEHSQIYDCSDGIITELPKKNIEEVIEKNGKGFRRRSPEKIERVCHDYMLQWHNVSNERIEDRPDAEVVPVAGEGTGDGGEPVEVGGD